MKHDENVKKLLQLIQENPGLVIVPLVDAGVVPSDDYRWWAGSWGGAGLDELCVTEGMVYFKSQNYEDLIESRADDLADSHPKLSDDALYEKAKALVDGYVWKKVIVVWIEEFY